MLVGFIAIVAMAGFRAMGTSVQTKAEDQADCVETFSCGEGNGQASQGEAITLTTPAPNGGDNDNKGDGGGFWSGVGNFFSSAASTTTSVAKGFFVDGAWGTVTGVWHIATHPIDTATGLWTAVTHPVDSFNAIKDGVVTAWNEDPARLIGAGLFEVVTLPVAGLKVTKASKIATVAKAVEEVDHVGDAARIVNKVDDVGDAARAAGKVDDVSDAQKAAEAAAAAARRRPPVSPQLEQKILYGERVPNPNSPGGMSNQVIGGHSPKLLDHPEFAIEVVQTNADGTTAIKFTKDLGGNQLSKIKNSTLAPQSWTDAKIIEVTRDVADTPSVATRARDGATLHRTTVDGVQWEVIRDSGGNITSSYPTGGRPTANF